jgi:hypothetical protein
MAKFCENCGSELKEDQDVCLGCGKSIKKAVKKGGHNGYFISTSIIMLVISFCLFCAFFYGEGEEPLVFFVPALFSTAAAIVCLAGKKNKVAVIVSGALYICGAIVNIIGIEDISIFTIMSLVFAGINIGFGCKMKN